MNLATHTSIRRHRAVARLSATEQALGDADYAFQEERTTADTRKGKSAMGQLFGRALAEGYAASHDCRVFRDELDDDGFLVFPR